MKQMKLIKQTNATNVRKDRYIHKLNDILNIWKYTLNIKKLL